MIVEDECKDDSGRCPLVGDLGVRAQTLCSVEASRSSSGLEVRMHPRVLGRFAEVGVGVCRADGGVRVRVAPCAVVDSVLRVGADAALVRRARAWTRDGCGVAVAASGALGPGLTTGARWGPRGTAALAATRQSQRTSAGVVVEDKGDRAVATLGAAVRRECRGSWWALGAEGAWQWAPTRAGAELCEAAGVCAAGWRGHSEAVVRLSAARRTLDAALVHQVGARWARGLTVALRAQTGGSSSGWRAWAAAEQQVDAQTSLRGAVAHDASAALVSVAHRVSEYTELLFAWHLGGQGGSTATLTLVLTD